MANKTTGDKTIHKQLRSSHHRRRRVVIRTRNTQYGFRNFVRNTWLSVAATAVMTITLLIISAAVIISQILSNTVAGMNDKVSDITIFFKSEASDDTLRVLAGKMKMTENVVADSVKYEDSNSVYNNFIEDNKYDQVKMNQINLIVESGVDPRDSFPAKLTLKVKDPNKIDPIRKIVDNDTDFKEWLNEEKAYKPSYDNNNTKNTINMIISWSNLAKDVGIGAGSIFLLISVLVIFNTIRMAIFSRREEIDMMRTIGADKQFIRGPFLIEAEIYGFFAAIIATTLAYIAKFYLLPGVAKHSFVAGTVEFVATINNIESVMNNWWFVILGAMMFAGMSIGYISARLAVRKYLK